MLKTFVSLIVLSSFAAAEERYSTKFDNVDYEEILKSDRLLKNYANCLLDKGGCTPDGRELKRILPDALATDCSKCSPSQRRGAQKVITFLIKNKAELWEQLMAKYDPTGEFREKHEQEWITEE